MKASSFHATLLLASVLLAASSAFAVDEGSASHPRFQAIEEATATGELGEAEGALYKAFAIRGSTLLPERYRPRDATPLKCGTQIMEQARRNLDPWPGVIRQEGRATLLRPNLPQYIDTSHFRIHYSTSGGNMIYGWPNTAYRDAVALSVETCWTYFHAQNGWPVPPSDGTAGGGSGLIDCYVDALNGVYGYTQSEYAAGQHVNDYTAYFVIDNDYAGFGYPDRTDPMKVTVAHEYHHVVQMGLNAINGAWWMENTSTFMEDEVYDEINDNYNYLQCYFGVPYNRLNNFNGCWEYAAFIWPTYLSEGLGGHSLVRDIWVDFADLTNLYTVFDNNLATYGLTLDTAMAEWARWNVFTGNRDDGHHYTEGGPYNRYIAYDNSLSTYPQYDRHPTSSKMPKGLGTNFTKLVPEYGSTDNKIEITYRGPSCSVHHVISFARKIAGEETYEEWDVDLDGSGFASLEMLRWDETEWLFLVVPMKRMCGSIGKDFSFDAVTSQQPTDVADLVAPTRIIRLDQNEPNPFNPKTTIPYALTAEGAVRLDIFDTSGRHVRTLVSGTQSAGEHTVAWFGHDDAGDSVPTGLYFYRLEVDGRREMRKMLLIE